ncbi:hypothetical protein PCE1_000222 [Barthelona sp. PCE]
MPIPDNYRPMDGSIEIISKRLYFLPLSEDKRLQPNDNTCHCFTIDRDSSYAYENFVSDFGPLNISQTTRFCRKLKSMLEAPKYQGKVLYFVTGLNQYKRSNAACLICCFMLLELKKSVRDICQIRHQISPHPLPFRDASSGVSTFPLYIDDVVAGLYRAIVQGIFDYDDFSELHYDFYSQVEHGDMSWIVPKKLLAFAGPCDPGQGPAALGYFHCTPQDYVPYFKKHEITDVIRLNRIHYNKHAFINENIEHHEMFYEDGALPTPDIVKRFFEIVDNSVGAIGVHCRAGLGRTGSLICLWLMRNKGFSARESLGYIRLMRPGSVIGQQQHFLMDREPYMRNSSKNTQDNMQSGNGHRSHAPQRHLPQNMKPIISLTPPRTNKMINITERTEVGISPIPVAKLLKPKNMSPPRQNPNRMYFDENGNIIENANRSHNR